MKLLNFFFLAVIDGNQLTSQNVSMEEKTQFISTRLGRFATEEWNKGRSMR